MRQFDDNDLVTYEDSGINGVVTQSNDTEFYVNWDNGTRVLYFQGSTSVLQRELDVSSPPPPPSRAVGIETAMKWVKGDPVNKPAHYQHPSGIEVIDITRHESFLRGNVLKYVLRAPYKNNELEDLKKAAKYLAWEIERVENDAEAR